MSNMKSYSQYRVKKWLRINGYTFKRNGKHIIYQCAGKADIALPNHGGDVKGCVINRQTKLNGLIPIE